LKKEFVCLEIKSKWDERWGQEIKWWLKSCFGSKADKNDMCVLLHEEIIVVRTTMMILPWNQTKQKGWLSGFVEDKATDISVKCLVMWNNHTWEKDNSNNE